MSKSRATFFLRQEQRFPRGRRNAGRNVWWVAAIRCGGSDGVGGAATNVLANAPI